MNVTVSDVLGSLFNPEDTVCFRVFDDKKASTFPGSKLQCECGKYKRIEQTLKNHNALGRGISRWTMTALKTRRKRSMHSRSRHP